MFSNFTLQSIFFFLVLQGAVAFSEQTKTDPTVPEGLPVDPLGEWYEVGYKMALETAPSFRMFSVNETDLSLRLNRVLETLGVDVQGIKLAELKLLQQGWDDGAAGKKQAMTFPPDQRGSLVSKEMRGFHRFNDSSSGDLAERAAEWKKAVALIQVETKKKKGHGTGFFIAPGLLLTNHHVVEIAVDDTDAVIEVTMESNRAKHAAKLIASTEVPDVALLKVDIEDNSILPIGDSDESKELQNVVLIGYPKVANLSATFNQGSISSTNRVLLDKFEVFQLDISANKGNSGGPLIALDGSVIGILTFDFKEIDPALSQFTFAQKINTITPFLEQNAKGKYSKRSQ